MRTRSAGSDAELLSRTAADVFGWQTLRPGQLAAMEAVLAGRDTLVVMPTGAGKSAVYQVAGTALPGPTVVVSPLIALQRDQIAGLPGDGGPEAVAVNSAQRSGQTRAAWEAVRHGDAEFLFLSPEQLAKDEVLDRLAQAGPSLFVVDEAQCVAAWGHDFRPDYLRLAHAVRRVGGPTVLALTATASPPVREEIVRRLEMGEDAAQVVAGFDRPNITLEVRRFAEEDQRRRAVVERAASEAKPGLVYTATRRDAEEYAAELAGLGLSAAAYHAGLPARERSRVHDAFLAGEADVVVATSAFGMGIDKEDVRFVLHAALPGSLDAYYQEIGRAGRDGGAAVAVLHYRTGDSGLQRMFATRTPDEETLGEVAEAVHEGDGPVDLDELGAGTDLPRRRVTAAANLLEQAGAVRTDDEGQLSPEPGVPADEAAQRASRTAEARKRLEESRLEMMRAYAETTGCRRRFLLGYFGEEYEAPCGTCDTCLAEDSPDPAAGTPTEGVTEPGAAPPGHPAAASYPAGTRVRHREWGDGMVMNEEGDRITVLFDTMGYRTLSLAAVTDSDLLTVRTEPDA
ncbi:RecQ family ATP-dependent DNA helicase [Streptomyces sp. enrichment culture]|uniref:RecQ family ATP-dependent DNA helicase n=1 Tax=Streptomyces sp. enrichment culture TaxID=1795815 RepID=UPI003F5593B4